MPLTIIINSFRSRIVSVPKTFLSHIFLTLYFINVFKNINIIFPLDNRLMAITFILSSIRFITVIIFITFRVLIFSDILVINLINFFIVRKPLISVSRYLRYFLVTLP